MNEPKHLDDKCREGTLERRVIALLDQQLASPRKEIVERVLDYSKKRFLSIK